MSYEVVRASAKHIFPELIESHAWHFDGQVALGNGTQWRFEMFYASGGGLFVRLEDRAAWSFCGKAKAEMVGDRLNIGEGDAGNVADLINDQICPGSERQGYYYPELCKGVECA